MITEAELLEIVGKTCDMPIDDLDVSQSLIRLQAEAKHLYYLLRDPANRPLQSSYISIIGALRKEVS